MSENEYSNRYLAFMGEAPSDIPHWEHWSNPDAETYITGIDYYKHPRKCRQKLNELYPKLDLSVPDSDEPKSKPNMDAEQKTSDSEKDTVRWGDGETGTWEHGEAYFDSPEEVFNFSPLEKADFREWEHVVVNWDFSSEEVIYKNLRDNYPEEWGDEAPEGSTASVGFYNTMFMWPLLTFGWELFLETCLDPRFERVMEEFAEINRRVFKAFARLPVNFVICHDDIVNTNGPVCSPEWMHKYIFPRYEEFWSIVKNVGKEVIFMSDGCIDKYADDVMACGARGIITEPYTDFKTLARKYKDAFLAGEGDNRILMKNNDKDIEKMVEDMVETAHINDGYMMCIGNHIPWNVPPEAVKKYLDYSHEIAYR